MSSDPNKKSTRSFQCRDVLWETFEQMARELECSVDYLINEAMKQYARQRSYGTGSMRTPFPSVPERVPDRISAPPPVAASNIPTPAVPAPPQLRAAAGLPPPPGRLPPPPMRSPGSLPSPPNAPRGLAPPARAPGGVPQIPSRPPPPSPRSVPPPI